MSSLKKLSTIVVFFFVLTAVGPNRHQEVQGNGDQLRALEHDVRAFGAKGDGRTLDTEAINKAIEAAAAAGGGTVRFTAGRYLSFSIRLKSNITLYLDHGATIVAADPKEANGSYDLPEPNEWDMYQDFGHSHWKNSLIWGIGLAEV